MSGPPDQGSASRWLSVWPTEQDSAGPLTEAAGMPPAVAAHAIAAYTQPGAVVLDPDCTAGVVLTEAIRTGRHAIGIAPDPYWWERARAAVTIAKRRGAPGDGTVLDQLPDLRYWIGLPRVDLVLTAIHPRSATGPGDPLPDGPEPVHERPAADWLDAPLSQYATLPRLGGRLVIVIPPNSTGSPPTDLAVRIIAAARRAGLQPVERAAALTHLPRTGTGRRDDARSADTDRPLTAPAHLDVIVLRRVAPSRSGPPRPDPPPSVAAATRDNTAEADRSHRAA